MCCFYTTQILLSLVLIGKVIEVNYRECSYSENKDIDLACVQFSQIPELSICTQFIGTLRLSKPANGPVCHRKLVLLYLCSILLAQSYAPEPVKFPCAIWEKAVKWTTPGVCCDSCDVWYHQECMGMPDCVYKGLKSISWECFKCGVPILSTSIFDTTIFEDSNPFSPLSNVFSPESDISFTYPNATSSPSRPAPQKTAQTRKDLPLRIVVLNCQSVKANGKPAQLKNIVSSLNADVIIGNESWLNSTIKSGEVFPDGFNSYRRDRPDSKGGCFFILVSQQYDSHQPEELIVDSSSDCEVVWVKVKVKGTSDLYIGSFYRPPDKNNPEYLQQLHSLLNRIPTDKGAHLWLGGDFNLPNINWEDESVSQYASNCTSVVEHNKRLLFGSSGNRTNQSH